MKLMKRCVWALLLGGAVLFPCAGESFLLVGEEILDGIRQDRPLSSVEGIMSAVFESGQIIFDTGALEVAVDWEARGFDEPLAMATEGRADYIMAACIDSRLIAGSAEYQSFTSRARYYLLDTAAREITGSGELELSNLGQEPELSYAELQYRLGVELGHALLRLWREGNRGMDKERKINKS
jgi:hypothetical protein